MMASTRLCKTSLTLRAEAKAITIAGIAELRIVSIDLQPQMKLREGLLENGRRRAH